MKIKIKKFSGVKTTGNGCISTNVYRQVSLMWGHEAFEEESVLPLWVHNFNGFPKWNHTWTYEVVKSFGMGTALSTFASGLMALCSGLTIGISAVMLPQLREDEDFQYDSSYDSWVASISTLSMAIGSLSVGSILDICGRKRSHIILSAPYIIGWFMIAFANSTTLILTGRFITGLSAGSNRPLALVYIGEISTPKYRSLFLYTPAVMVLLGVLLAHLIGSFVSWRLSATLCAVPAIACSIVVMFLKESPLWLIAKGRTEEGIESFRWFRGMDEDSEKELTAVLNNQGKKESAFTDFRDVFLSRTFIKPAIVLALLMVNIQFSGINVINFYANDIFELTFSGKIDTFAIMIGLDFIRLLVSSVIVVFGKNIPRKIFLITISIGVGFILSILIIYIVMDIQVYLWVPIAVLCIYTGLVSSIITVGWTFVPEIIPTKVRGIGSGMTSTLSYILLFSLVKVTPDIMNLYGVEYLYLVFGVSTVFCAIVLFWILPDTSGKTLQAIEDSYNSKGKIEQSKL